MTILWPIIYVILNAVLVTAYPISMQDPEIGAGLDHRSLPSRYEHIYLLKRGVTASKERKEASNQGTARQKTMPVIYATPDKSGALRKVKPGEFNPTQPPQSLLRTNSLPNLRGKKNDPKQAGSASQPGKPTHKVPSTKDAVPAPVSKGKGRGSPSPPAANSKASKSSEKVGTYITGSKLSDATKMSRRNKVKADSNQAALIGEDVTVPNKLRPSKPSSWFDSPSGRHRPVRKHSGPGRVVMSHTGSRVVLKNPQRYARSSQAEKSGEHPGIGKKSTPRGESPTMTPPGSPRGRSPERGRKPLKRGKMNDSISSEPSSPGGPSSILASAGSSLGPSLYPASSPDSSRSPNRSPEHTRAPNQPTMSLSPSDSPARSRSGSPNARMRSISPPTRMQSRPSRFADRLIRGAGAQAYYGDSNPGAVTNFMMNAISGATTVGGVALSAGLFPGHAVAGTVLVGAGVCGALAANCHGHINSVRNHANKKKLGADDLRERGKETAQPAARVLRGASHVVQTAAHPIRQAVRPIGQALKNAASLEKNMDLMDHDHNMK